jgi:hypothetical protein
MSQIRGQVLNRSSAPRPRPTRARGDGDAWAGLLNDASRLWFRQGTRKYTGARVFVFDGLHPVPSGCNFDQAVAQVYPLAWTVKSTSTPPFLAITLAYLGEMAPIPLDCKYQILTEFQKWCCARPGTLTYTLAPNQSCHCFCPHGPTFCVTPGQLSINKLRTSVMQRLLVDCPTLEFGEC